MTAVSDIPDWCFVEAGLAFPADGVVTAEAFAAMRHASPIAHVGGVQAPTLLMLGGADLRVPPSQGLLWHHALQSRGVLSRVLWYADEGHSLAGLACDADCFVHVALWLREHVA